MACKDEHYEKAARHYRRDAERASRVGGRSGAADRPVLGGAARAAAAVGAAVPTMCRTRIGDAAAILNGAGYEREAREASACGAEGGGRGNGPARAAREAAGGREERAV